MKATDFSKKRITNIYTNANKYGVGEKIVLLFEDESAIFIDKFWGYYFRINETLKNKFTALNELKIISDNTFLENATGIEGVSTYLKLSTGTYIYLYHQVEDLERFSFYYSINVFNIKNHREKYAELKEDISYSEDIIFEKCNNIELKFN